MPSSVVRLFQYDPEKRQLLVVFQTGRKYAYHDVPQHIYDEMIAAFSKGDFFNANVRNRFRFTRR